MTKFPCPTCGEPRMAHPDNDCADCYLAKKVLDGTFDLSQIRDPDRVLRIDNRIRALKALREQG